MSGWVLCLHLGFTIDRIEGDFTVVEWLGSVLTTDVSTALYPRPPSEGEQWMIHLAPSTDGETRLDDSFLALTNPKGTIGLPKALTVNNQHQFRLRMTRTPNTSTPGGALP
jgi:hypothetical protein